MKYVELYNAEYTKLNHTYNEIFSFYEKLTNCSDEDSEVVDAIETILRIFNPTLDEIKSKMTVKTRYVGESDNSDEEKPHSKPKIIQGKF